MSVVGLVSAVAGFVKVRYVAEKAVIDNLVFRCHYRLTTAVLLLACVLVTANNLIGDPIACITDGGVPSHVINTYCWITTTFTLPEEHGSIIGSEVPHPGVANHLGGRETRHHAYYQWVPFMLFFQGVLFYAPHWIWKNWEEGKIRHLTDGLRGANTVLGAEKDARQSKLVQYVFDTLHRNNVYATGYYICEIINFVNVILNMFLVDVFLGGAFMRYGTEVLTFSSLPQESRYDPMVAVFPRVTKCTFHKYGPSGTVQTHDALCVLALNILNEKIYIFLWFWLIILAVLSGLALVYSTAVVLLPSIREKILLRRFRFGTPAGVSALVAKTQIGDFLLLHLMGQNMNMMVFGEFLDELSRKLHLGNNIPTAPSTMELSPIYPSAKLRSLETEA